MTAFDEQCLSYYLAFRYVPDQDRCWKPGVCPELPELEETAAIEVTDATAVLEALPSLLPGGEGVGLLLSGGIDSAILAALLPKGTPCYTIGFDAKGAVDETAAASLHADAAGHPLTVIRVTWADYRARMPALFDLKRSPLHAIEVALFKAAEQARADGIRTLIVGNGADSTFGGLDKLLSVDWAYARFIRRYNFAQPEDWLADPRDVEHIYAPYRSNGGVDVQGFLKRVHGLGIIQSFETAIHAAGVDVVAPYEDLVYPHPLDIARIRKGEAKYVLRDVYKRLYGDPEIPRKIAFARPMDVWLQTWEGPGERPEFREDTGRRLRDATGEERWLVYCLAQFLEHFDDA